LDLPKCDVCEEHDVQITCIMCNLNFCKSCDEKHHSKGKLKTHQRDIYSGLTPSRFCVSKGHEKQTLSLFCQVCSKLICGFCVGDHKAHTYVGAEVAAANAKEVLKDSIVPLQDSITKAQVDVKTSQEKIKVLQGEIKKEEENIREIKRNIDENLQKIEDIKSLLRKNESDSFTLLSMVSNLKLELNPHFKLFEPLALWLNKPVKTWKLLYKWTKTDKTGQAWEKQCVGKSPTITIVWANNGHVFGGYVHKPWASDGGYEHTKECFLFSLTDGKNRQPYQCLPSRSRPKNLNLLNGDFDFSFYLGFGSSDLSLNISPGKNDSYSRLGGTYECPKGFQPQTFLAGLSGPWTIDEIETYLV